MSDIISLGKKENLGEIDLDKLKSGITKKDLGIEPETVLSSIFDRLDANGNQNGTLDRAEINKFIEIVKKLCRKDNNLSEKEAGKFELDDEDKKTGSKEFLKFLSKMADLTKGVESVQKNDGYEVVTYSDGKVEEIYDDGSRLTREKIGEETCETIYDANGNEIRRTTIDKNNKITSDFNTTYDENGTPVSKSSLVKTVMHTSGENPKAIDGVCYTQYTYYKGYKEFVEDESTTIAQDSASKTIIKSYRKKNGDNEDLEIQNGLYVRHSKTENGKTRSLQFDEQGCLRGYVIQSGETADSIAKKFGVSKELLLKANPKSNFLVLDEIRIPKQFDIDDPAVQDMKSRSEVWDSAPKIETDWHDPETNEYWTEELVVVKDKLKHGWKVAVDKEGTQYIFTKNNKRLSDEEVQDQLYWDSLKKVKAKAEWGNPVVGIVKKGLTRGRMLVRTRDGAMYIMSSDHMLLDEQYAAETEYFDKHKKVKGRIKDKNGNVVTKDFVVLKDGLRNGRKIVMDSNGNRWLMAADGTILNEKVAAENDYKEDIAKDPKKAMKASLAIVKTMYNKAKAAFDKYLKQEGWTEKAADAISVLWGSENRAEVVKQKLDYYGHQIKELEYYLSKNDFDRFSGAFKEMFKVDFRPQSISDYVKNPTEHNYINAFGVENDIALRVQKYIQSQGLGGSIVKAAGTAVGGLISAIAVPPSAPAGVSVAIGAIGAGAASLLIGLTDRASSDVGLQDGEIAGIIKDAGFDGLSVVAGGAIAKGVGVAIKGASKCAAMARAAANTAGNIAYGAADQYVRTGSVSVEGVLMVAAIPTAVGAGKAVAKGIKNGAAKIASVMRSEGNSAADIPAAAEASYTGTVKGMNPALAEANDIAGHSYKGRTAEVPDTDSANNVAKTAQGKTKKNISEMNENELFDEYKHLYNETKNSGVDIKTKAENIKKMKEIKQSLNEKGLNIEGEKLVSQTEQTSIVPEEKIIASLDKKHTRYYEAIQKSIAKMETILDFQKIMSKIEKFFEGLNEVKNYLIKQLQDKADKLGIYTKKYEPTDTQIKVANENNAQILNMQKATCMNFQNGDKFVVDLEASANTQLSLGPIIHLDMSDPKLQTLLRNMKDGDKITIGAYEGKADYKIGSYQNGVSRCHLEVSKINGEYIFKDTSTYGTIATQNAKEKLTIKEVKKMFKNDELQKTDYTNLVNMNEKLTKEDYELLTQFINKSHGKYIDMWNDACILDNGRNVDKLAAFVKLLRRSTIRSVGAKEKELMDKGFKRNEAFLEAQKVKQQIYDFYLNMDDATWDAAVNNICQKSRKAIDAILNYKLSSRQINDALSRGSAPTAEISKYINEMTGYINTQTINKPIKVYRGEQCSGSLSRVKLPDGRNLGEAMETLIKKNATPKEIEEFINKYAIGKSVSQERFMSTALDEDFTIRWAKKDTLGDGKSCPVNWEIDVPEGSRGVFTEDFNVGYENEFEFIMQRGSSLVIKGAHFDTNKNIWIIEATIEQTPYENLGKY